MKKTRIRNHLYFTENDLSSSEMNSINDDSQNMIDMKIDHCFSQICFSK